MIKKVTLNSLVSYVLSHCNKTQYSEYENNCHEFKSKFKTLEDVKFCSLNNRTSKNINDFPPRLKQIFDPFISNLERCGNMKTYNNKNEEKNHNISLFYSILFCILDSFNFELSDNKQIKLIYDFRDKLIKDINRLNLYEKFKYKNIGWTKNELIKSINNFKNNKMVIRFLSDYFHINIFLLDIQDDKIYAIFKEEYFNIFKMNLFLVFHNNMFEPMILTKHTLLNYNDEPLKKLINVDKLTINIFNDDFSVKPVSKVFQIGTENLDEYLSNLNLDKYGKYKNIDHLDNSYNEIIDGGNDGHNTDLLNEVVEDTDVVITTIKNEIFYTKSKKMEKGNKSKLLDDVTDNTNNKLLLDDVTDNTNNKLLLDDVADNTNNKLLLDDVSNNDHITESNRLNNVNMKMKLIELQVLATKFGISTQNGLTKHGKKKMKTKGELIKELSSIKI
jgi:hypothetical protein